MVMFSEKKKIHETIHHCNAEHTSTKKKKYLKSHWMTIWISGISLQIIFLLVCIFTSVYSSHFLVCIFVEESFFDGLAFFELRQLNFVFHSIAHISFIQYSTIFTYFLMQFGSGFTTRKWKNKFNKKWTGWKTFTLRRFMHIAYRPLE